MNNKPLLIARPVFFRAAPVMITVCFLLAVAILIAMYSFDIKGIRIALCVVLLIVLNVPLKYFIASLTTTIKINERETELRKGLLSKSTSTVRHEDVRNIQIDQSIIDRILAVGSIGISSAGQSNVEIAVKGVPSPYKLKEQIDSLR